MKSIKPISAAIDIQEEFYNEIRKNQITLIYDTELNTFIKGEEYVEKYNISNYKEGWN